jgi:DNA-binding CsgD family transcriptional regulator
LLAQGFSSKEIAKVLGISPETIRKHLAKIRDVVGMRRAAELSTYWHSLNTTVPSSEELPAADLEPLTPREQEVAQLLMKGYTAKEVAKLLKIAPGTAAKHRENLLRKLGINRTSLLPRKLE